jgi:hypothetical protein
LPRQDTAAWTNGEKQARPAIKEKIILRFGPKRDQNRLPIASYLVRPNVRCIAAIARIAWPGSSLFVASEKLSDFKFVEIKFERIASRI